MAGRPMRGSIGQATSRRNATFNSDNANRVTARRGNDSLERPTKVEEQADEEEPAKLSSGKDPASNYEDEDWKDDIDGVVKQQ